MICQICLSDVSFIVVLSPLFFSQISQMKFFFDLFSIFRRWCIFKLPCLNWISTLECLIAVHVRLFFFQNFGRMYGLIRHCMSIYTRITEFITYKKPKRITVCITILSYLYVKYALLQACMFKNSLKQLCLYIYMDCTAIKHSRVHIY